MDASVNSLLTGAFDVAFAPKFRTRKRPITPVVANGACRIKHL